MSHGKCQTKRNVPTVIWVLIILLLLGMTIGGVVAYLFMSGESVKNTFKAEASTDPTILETMDSNVKTDVKVNVGNPGYAVYVRAAVVITWRDSDGNVLAQSPVADTDYTISMGDGWFSHDGFWYCKTMVKSPDGQEDGISPTLINTCKALTSKPGYHLHVEIISQTIQALGTTDEGDKPAVTEAWGIKVDPTTKELIIETP